MPDLRKKRRVRPVAGTRGISIGQARTAELQRVILHTLDCDDELRARTLRRLWRGVTDEPQPGRA